MRSFFKALLWIFGTLAVVCGILYLTIFDVWTIPSDDPQLTVSIEPELGAGDTILVHRSTNPDIGSLVRCTDPDQAGKFVIARIIGKGGDDLEIRDGTFLYNGHAVSAPVGCEQGKVTVRNPVTQNQEELSCSTEEFAGIAHPALRVGKDNRSVKVDVGKVYLLSDNRLMHLDSRDYGQIDPNTCQRISFRLWGEGGWSNAKRRLTMIW